MENILTESEYKTKGAAVVLGRFSPPHRGHYALFNKVKKWIKNNPELNLYPLPIVLVIAGKKTSEDKQKNPLEPKDRISMMQSSKLADGVKFLTASTAFEAFEKVREAGFEPIAVATGTDRQEQYIDMLDKYFKNNEKPVKHYSINLERTEPGIGAENKQAALDDVLKYTDKDIPIELISGSLVRRAVQQNELEKFKILTGLQSDAADIMFKKIKRSLEGKNGNT